MFRNSQSHEPSGRPEPDPQEVERLARRAAILAGQGDTTAAMQCYQLALLTDESRPDLWFNYGTLQHRIGQLADALESFEFALRLDGSMYPARCRLARVCCDLGRPLEALSQFRLVIQQRPGYIPAWRELVRITWALGNLAEAEACACEALVHAHDAEIAAMLERIVEDRQAA